jgi:hypothetical protein
MIHSLQLIHSLQAQFYQLIVRSFADTIPPPQPALLLLLLLRARPGGPTAREHDGKVEVVRSCLGFGPLDRVKTNWRQRWRGSAAETSSLIPL